MVALTDTEQKPTPSGRKPPATRFLNVRGGRLLERLAVPAAIIVAWWAVTAAGAVRPLFLPSPGGLWDAFMRLRPELGSATISSVALTLSGFLIGTAGGALIGLLLAFSKHLRIAVGGIFDALRPIPIFALIPLFVLWFGLGRVPQVVLVAFGTFVVLVVTTIEAVHNVSPIYVKAALNLGASREFIYRTVVVPSITPHLAGAIRVSAAASWGLGVAAEFIGAQNGLGYLMITRETYLDTAGILVLVIIYAIIAFLFDLIVQFLQRRGLKWTERGQLSSHIGSVLGVS